VSTADRCLETGKNRFTTTHSPHEPAAAIVRIPQVDILRSVALRQVDGLVREVHARRTVAYHAKPRSTNSESWDMSRGLTVDSTAASMEKHSKVVKAYQDVEKVHIA
jgi:hypothetical protein